MISEYFEEPLVFFGKGIEFTTLDVYYSDSLALDLDGDIELG